MDEGKGNDGDEGGDDGEGEGGEGEGGDTVVDCCADGRDPSPSF